MTTEAMKALAELDRCETFLASVIEATAFEKHVQPALAEVRATLTAASAPAPAEPQPASAELSDEQIIKLSDEVGLTYDGGENGWKEDVNISRSVIKFTRAIEAALKGKP